MSCWAVFGNIFQHILLSDDETVWRRSGAAEETKGLWVSTVCEMENVMVVLRV